VYSSSSSFISKSESDSGGANVGAGTTTEGLGVSDLALLATDWRLFGFGAASVAFSTFGDCCSGSGGPQVANISSSSVTSHESVRPEQVISVICVSQICRQRRAPLMQDHRQSMPSISVCSMPLQNSTQSSGKIVGPWRTLSLSQASISQICFCITLRHSRHPSESAYSDLWNGQLVVELPSLQTGIWAAFSPRPPARAEVRGAWCCTRRRTRGRGRDSFGQEGHQDRIISRACDIECP